MKYPWLSLLVLCRSGVARYLSLVCTTQQQDCDYVAFKDTEVACTKLKMPSTESAGRGSREYTLQMAKVRQAALSSTAQSPPGEYYRNNPSEVRGGRKIRPPPPPNPAAQKKKKKRRRGVMGEVTLSEQSELRLFCQIRVECRWKSSTSDFQSEYVSSRNKKCLYFESRPHTQPPKKKKTYS